MGGVLNRYTRLVLFVYNISVICRYRGKSHVQVQYEHYNTYLLSALKIIIKVIKIMTIADSLVRFHRVRGGDDVFFPTAR